MKKSEETAEVLQTAQQTVEKTNKTEEKKREEKAEAKMPKTVIWLGPAIKGIVSKNKIFNNGLNTELEEFCKKYPAAECLIVNIKDTADARRELKDGDSVRSVCYGNVLKTARQEGINE